MVDLDSCPAEEVLDPNDLSGDSDSESDLGAEQSYETETEEIITSRDMDVDSESEQPRTFKR